MLRLNTVCPLEIISVESQDLNCFVVACRVVDSLQTAALAGVWFVLSAKVVAGNIDVVSCFLLVCCLFLLMTKEVSEASSFSAVLSFFDKLWENLMGCSSVIPVCTRCR